MRRIASLLVISLLVAGCGDDDTAVTSSDREPVRDPEQRYRVAAVTVLESPDHGPQLCLGGVAESYPPQCGGIDVDGWSWDGVAGAESASGTTWATVSVVGTFDGATFTLTEPPGAPAPADGDPTDFSPICDDYDDGAGPGRLDVGLEDIPDVLALWVSDPAGDWDGPFVVNVIARPGSADDVRAAIRERWQGALCVVERDQPSPAELERVQREVHDADDAPFGGVFGSSADAMRGVVVVEVAIADAVSTEWARERWGDLVELRGALVPVD